MSGAPTRNGRPDVRYRSPVLRMLTAKTVSDRGSISASKSYSTRQNYRFSQKFLAELANAQAVATVESDLLAVT